MSKAISKQEVVRCSIRGIRRAFKRFYDLSDGLWLWEAPEYWVTVFIADEIALSKHQPKLELEYSTKKAIKEGGGARKGRFHRYLGGKKRFDIILRWTATDRPRAIIEVKSPMYSMGKPQLRDVKRISRALTNSANQTIQFGILAFYSDTKFDGRAGRKKLEKRMKGFLSKARDNVPESKITLKKSIKVVSGEGARCLGCFTIQARAQS